MAGNIETLEPLHDLAAAIAMSINTSPPRDKPQARNNQRNITQQKFPYDLCRANSPIAPPHRRPWGQRATGYRIQDAGYPLS